MVEVVERRRVLLPWWTVRVRGAEDVSSGNPPMHTYQGSLCACRGKYCTDITLQSISRKTRTQDSSPENNMFQTNKLQL